MVPIDLTHYVFLFEEPLETLWIQSQTNNAFVGVLKVPTIIDGEPDSVTMPAGGTINSMVKSPTGRKCYSITMHAGTRLYTGAALSLDVTDRHFLFAGTYSYTLSRQAPGSADPNVPIGPIPFAGVGRKKN